MTAPTVPQTYDWTFRRVVGATLIFAAVAFGFWLIFHFYQVVFILFIAIVLGTVIRPLANWLSQRGLPRAASVLLIYLVLLVLLAGFLWLLFPVIFAQTATITREVPVFYQSFREGMLQSSNQFVVRLGVVLPATLPGLNAIPVAPDGENVVASAEQIWLYTVGAAQVLFIFIVILVLTLYWALDGPRILKSVLLLAPQGQRDSLAELITAMEAKVGYYIAGQALLCLTIGILALIAYTIIGLPNALVLALAAGVMEAVPMVGPALGAVPAGLVALSIAPTKVIWVVVATIIIQQTENSLLVPRIMKRAVGVNPFVTLLSLFAFGSLFGVAGALMAIPMAAIAQLALNHFVFTPPVPQMEPTEGRNYASRIRYEAQDLIQDLRKQARHKKRGSDQKIIQIEQLMDEIETITTDLDTLLAEANTPDVQ
jgi:predicted PurR-regulated permease PerM